MAETRIFKRRHLIYYLPVHNGESGELLGHLADLTTHGCRLLSGKPISGKENYLLRLLLPDTYPSRRELQLEARRVWSSTDVNPDYCATGFATPATGAESQRTITELIHLYGFRD